MMAAAAAFPPPEADPSNLVFFSLQRKERKADCCVMCICASFLGGMGGVR
jgi:hypothetical protein